MSNEVEKVHKGVVIDEEEFISFIQLCRNCNHSDEEIIELVEEGILEPIGGQKQELRFHYRAIARTRRVKRLQKDFELDLAASGLVMQLLERIEELESKFNKLNR